MLDRIDREILRLLQNDARISNKELAHRVHLAPSTCLERVRRLRETGVIHGTRTIVEPRTLGIGLEAILIIQMRQQSRDDLERFRRALLSRPEVIRIYHLAGVTDFMVHVAVRDVDHLRDFGLDQVTSREDVRHVETSLVFHADECESWPDYEDVAADEKNVIRRAPESGAGLSLYRTRTTRLARCRGGDALGYRLFLLPRGRGGAPRHHLVPGSIC